MGIFCRRFDEFPQIPPQLQAARELNRTHSVEQARTSPAPADSTFLGRHEFLLRRLHSLSGIVPVGVYMVIHLLTNSTIVQSPGTFQLQVYTIHGLPMLPVIEWVFIFIPLLFHAIYGVLIIRGALPNHSTYRYSNNVRYTLQRATGMIAFVFIVWHVFHMHGWIHAAWWENAIRGFGGMFKPFNAASTGAEAIQGNILYPILYVIGLLACVFHLSNGIWTFGITWGLWTSTTAQNRAAKVCDAFGVALAIVGLTAVWGFSTTDPEKARVVEERMLKSRIEAGELDPADVEHKSAHPPVEAATASKP